VPSFTTRYFLSIGNVLTSFVLGALAMIFCWLYFPDQFVQIVRAAGGVREWVVSRNWPPRYEGALRLLLHDQTLVFVGFTLVTRIIVGAIIALVSRMIWGRAEIAH
jgi:hypothetical protein